MPTYKKCNAAVTSVMSRPPGADDGWTPKHAPRNTAPRSTDSSSQVDEVQMDEMRRRLIRIWCYLKDDPRPRRPSRRALQEVEILMATLDIPLEGPSRAPSP